MQMPWSVERLLKLFECQPRRGRVHGLHHRLGLVELALEKGLILPDLVHQLLHLEFLARQFLKFKK